jgi:hypothetical protein
MQLNNKELRITAGSFADAMALQKAIGRALKGSKLELPESMTVDMAPDKLGDIIGAVLGVATSDEVEACLFACSARAVLGQDKIDRDFFENVDNRELYYPIMVEIIKVNVGPFIKGLASKFGALGALAGSSPK